MNTQTALPCEMLPWDTDFFGYRIARVCGDRMCEEQALHIDEWSRSNRIRVLYFLSRLDDPETIHTAERYGFGLVDIRVTLDCVIRSNPPALQHLPAGISMRSAEANDVAGLQSMARTLHTQTRFFKDPLFPRRRAEDLYSTWIALEAQGRAQVVLLAASVTNEPLGYVSCHLDVAGQQGQIGLLGVGSAVRRLGLGQHLVLTALDWFRSRAVTAVTVVTQGDNLAAQRLYQRCGFLTRDVQLWYHKWYRVADFQPLEEAEAESRGC